MKRKPESTMKLKPNQLPASLYRKRTLLFFCMMQLFLLAIVCLSIHVYENREIHKEFVADSLEVMGIFQSDIDHETSILHGLLPIVKNDPTIIEAWLARDRVALLESSKGFLEHFQQRFKVTHFYFHDLDSVNFLRVHFPERHGDLINRFTMAKAKQQNKDYGGIELGPLGTFALRLVSPWVIDGRLTGYVELGMEIDYIMQHLEETHDLGLAILIRKSYLNLQAWEDGQQIFSRTGNWDTYKEFMVTEKRNVPLPPTMMFTKEQPDRQSHAIQKFKSDGNQFCSVLLPLLDAGDREVGYMLFINDYTENLESQQQLLLLISAVFVVVGAVLFVAFNFILVRLTSARLKAEEEQALLFTQHKRTVEDLRYSQTTLETVFRNSIPMCITSRDYEIIHANESYYSVFGEIEETAGEIKCYDSRPGKLCHTEDCPMKQIIQGKEIVTTESIKPDHEGNDRHYIITTRPFLDSNGDFLGIVESFQDITKRKSAEQEKEKIQDQLLQSQKMEAIGTLAGGIAHDFNNLLNSIIGFTELLLLRFPEKDVNYQDLKQIQSAGLQAAELVQQILTFSRRNKTERRSLHIQILLKEILKLLRSSIPATIIINQDIDPDCSPILVDYTQIHQVIMNLCTNAYHAMREEGGIMSVKLAEVDIDSEKSNFAKSLSVGRYIQLTISDTGHGIEPTTMERIFDPYFTTKEQGQGTGLGLAIVHGIIKNHSGAIIAKSKPGISSTFTIYLPVSDNKVVESHKEEEEKSLPKISGRVMFVDDVEANVLLGKSVLESLGCEVVGLTDSREALEVFRVSPDRFDIVVTDQTMPNITGLELAQQLFDIRPDITIFMVTGYSEFVNEEKAKSIGIREFFMKPLDIFKIAAAISRIVPGDPGVHKISDKMQQQQNATDHGTMGS